MLEDGGEYLEPDFYFITYEHRKNGKFGILDSMEEFPGWKARRTFGELFEKS